MDILQSFLYPNGKYYAFLRLFYDLNVNYI